MGKLSELIVKLALQDVGNKEKPNNSGWFNAQKEKAMRLAGWLVGQAWCSYNAEVIYVNAFTIEDPNAVSLLKKYFSGSTVETWKNFRASREFKTSPNVPKLGALVIWQSYKNGVAQSTGHIGVVTEINGGTFKSVEGNTSEAGSREGTVVGINSHNIANENARTNGLQIIGFVYCERIA